MAFMAKDFKQVTPLSMAGAYFCSQKPLSTEYNPLQRPIQSSVVATNLVIARLLGFYNRVQPKNEYLKLYRNREF